MTTPVQELKPNILTVVQETVRLLTAIDGQTANNSRVSLDSVHLFN